MEVPFINQEAQEAIERIYVPQKGPKALAIALGALGMSRKAADEESAKAEALRQCESRVQNGRRCTLYAVGDTIVWDHPAPRIATAGPLMPRFTRVAAADADNIPFLNDEARKKILEDYLKLALPKALAVGPGGAIEFVSGSGTADDVIRRSLQICAERVRAACLLIALNDDAVTRVPHLMRPVGLLDIDREEGLSQEQRQQLIAAAAEETWYAFARGAGGIAGVASSKNGESGAIDAALAACRTQGSGTGCAVWAIGPYIVKAK
jgi:adenylate cyclase